MNIEKKKQMLNLLAVDDEEKEYLPLYYVFCCWRLIEIHGLLRCFWV